LLLPQALWATFLVDNLLDLQSWHKSVFGAQPDTKRKYVRAQIPPPEELLQRFEKWEAT
jgi:hypothetical protein